MVSQDNQESSTVLGILCSTGLVDFLSLWLSIQEDQLMRKKLLFWLVVQKFQSVVAVGLWVTVAGAHGRGGLLTETQRDKKRLESQFLEGYTSKDRTSFHEAATQGSVASSSATGW